jgi:hypothetical protein
LQLKAKIIVGIRIAFRLIMFYKVVILFFLFACFSVQAQDINKPIKNGYLVQFKIVDGDTIPFINLREIIIFPPHQFHSKREVMKYAKLVRNIKKVLPYAKIARTKLFLIESEVEKIPTESERKEFLKHAENALKDDFQDEITNLTMTQGRLLIKLIDRETGNTSYALIKELKGSFNAFLYQSIARIFGENLKDEYDPKGDDKLVEEIVVRIENGEY